jgi:hypothetical protein
MPTFHTRFRTRRQPRIRRFSSFPLVELGEELVGQARLVGVAQHSAYPFDRVAFVGEQLLVPT